MALLAVREHMRHECLKSVEHAIEVDAHDPVPILVGDFPDAAASFAQAGDAGVVDKDVNLVEGVEGALGELPDRFAATCVDTDANDGMTLRFELRDCGGEHLLLDIGEHDVHAGGCEQIDKPATDAAGRTGDDRGFSLEFAHGFSPFRVDASIRSAEKVTADAVWLFSMGMRKFQAHIGG